MDPQSNNIFLGTIGRKILTTLLYHEQYYIVHNNYAMNSETWSESSGKIIPPAGKQMYRNGDGQENDEEEE